MRHVFQNFCLVLGMGMLGACSSTGEVVVRTQPVGAKVYVLDSSSGQGALVGQTPLSFKKAQHAREGTEVIMLKIEKEGYQSRNASVANFGGGVTYLDLALPASVVADDTIRLSFEKVRNHMLQANRLVSANRYSDAVGEIAKALELDPKNADAHAAKGSILFLMKDLEGARESWSKALELNPNYDEVRASLIDLNLATESSKRAPASGGNR